MTSESWNDAAVIRPVPECFSYPLGAGWEFRVTPPGSRAAWVDLEKKIICVPGGNSPYDQIARLHEMGHVRISEANPILLAKRAACHVRVIQALEDARVHHFLTQRAGFDLTPGCVAPEEARQLVRWKTETGGELRDLTCMIIATVYTGTHEIVRELVRSELGKARTTCARSLQLAELAIRMLFRSPNPGTAEMLDTARWLEQELQKSEKSPQASHSRDKKRSARRPGPGPKSGRDKNSPVAEDEPNPGVDAETENACWLPPMSPGQHEWDVDDSKLSDVPHELKKLMEHFHQWYPRLRDPNWEPRAGENPRWADMEVQWLDGKRQPRNCWRPRYRACREGTQVRFVHRILTDRKPFVRQKRAPAGTILIDASGSMSLCAADVVKILDHAPGATVAMYCGSGTLGVVRVLAYDGKVAERRSFENDIGKGNLIDGEALRFLAGSPQPRYWVSDALVTGLGETTHDGLRRDAREVCRTGRITRFPDVENMVEFLKNPNVRSVRRFFGQDAVVVKSESPSI